MSVMEIAMKEMGDLIGLAKANLKVLPGPIVNVGGYGAVGDGVTDDTAAVQAAIEYVLANGMKTVFFPHGKTGEYYVTALTDADQVNFMGENAHFVGGLAGVEIAEFSGIAALKAETVKVFNVTAYGASPILADNAVAIQAAIDDCISAGGGVVFFSAGIYASSAVEVDGNSVILEGENRGNTIIDFSGDGIAVDISGDYCGIRDLQIRNVGTPISGAAVRVSNNAFGCLFDALTITGFYYGFDFVAAKSWNLTDSYLFNNLKYEVYIRNTDAPDSGDQVISGCTFDSSIDTDAAIRHESGGGVKIIGNKILRHKIGYDLKVEDGAETSVTVINGNSIEMQSVRHARLGRLGSTGTYAQIVISGNQLNYYNTALTDGFLIEDGIDNVNINGNSSNGPSDKPFVNVVGGADIVIEGNLLAGWQIGTKISSGIDGVRVGINNYVDVARPIEDNTVSTAGTMPPLIDHYYIKKITGVTSASEYTKLFRLDMQAYRSCVVELTVDGILAGVQQVGRHIAQIITRSDGNPSQTSISETNAGAVIDVQFDNTTTTGSVIIGVRRNASAGGTQLDGVATLRITGHVQGINIL